MNINVVNKKTHRPEACDVYIGRPSALGNPYSVEKYGRDGCIKMFETEFNVMIQGIDMPHLNYESCKQQLKAIENAAKLYNRVNLVCWCAPLACHGDVIAEYFHKMFNTSDRYDDLLRSGLLQPEDL